MLVRRLMAEVVDLLINIMLLVFEAKIILPIFTPLINNTLIYFMVSLTTFIGLIILVQGLFWNNGESIGKFFMHLKVEKTDRTDVPFQTMIVREFMVKYISFYFSSVPLLFGKEAVQCVVTETVVRSKNVASKV